MTYTVYINRGVTDPFGWNAEHDFDGLIAAGNQPPNRDVVEHAGTIWGPTTDDKSMPTRLQPRTCTHDRHQGLQPWPPATTDPAASGPTATTMWVVD